MEYLQLRRCSNQSRLGRDLADLHLHNWNRRTEAAFVPRFGFPLETCCGFLPQGNGWADSWVEFYRDKVAGRLYFYKGPTVISCFYVLAGGTN